MTQFGFTMLVNGIPDDYNGIQLVEHRILHYIDPNQQYNEIKHQLLYGVYSDFAFSKPFNLDYILNKCSQYNISLIANICATEGKWKNHNQLTPSQYAKIGGVLRDILKDRRLNKAYIGAFNEPGKVFNTFTTCKYANALHDEVGKDFDVVYGNDEFNMLDWNYLGASCRAKVMGIHHLSSVGYWDNPYKYFKNVRDCRIIANNYKKQIIATECGSWFKDYCSSQGHDVNLDILAECKEFGYDGCLIVLPDINEKSKTVWKLLGYRIWDNAFNKMIGGCKSKFDEMIDFIKKEGEAYKGDDSVIFESIYRRGSRGVVVKFIQECCNELILETTEKPIVADGIYGAVTEQAVKEMQAHYGLEVDGICGEKTMKRLCYLFPECLGLLTYRWGRGER